MIYTPKVTTGTQHILTSRKKRRIHRRYVNQFKKEPNGNILINLSPIKRNQEKVLHVGSNCVLKSIIQTEKYWHKSYIKSPYLTNKKFHKKLRCLFCIRYDSFRTLLHEVSTSTLFCRWKSSRIIERPKLKPIRLLLLGALRYLGRGWTFDDLEQTTRISEKVHRHFFRIFIKFGQHVLYPIYVKYPKNSKEGKTHINEFIIADLDGGAGSMDACHVTIDKCSHRLKFLNLGGKSKRLADHLI